MIYARVYNCCKVLLRVWRNALFTILAKRELAKDINEYVIDAPLVAKNAKPGQFIILIVEEGGERVPFTICDMNKVLGTVTILVQTVGATTAKLAKLNAGDTIASFVGPLGNPTDLSGYKKVMLVGGGIGGAVIYPQAKLLHKAGIAPVTVMGARNKDLLIYENEMRTYSSRFYPMTDDGSYGDKGFVTNKVKKLLDTEDFDVILAVGPMPMMEAVTNVARDNPVKVIVSMNSVMVDGTGMCGCCRVTVGGETKYACVDGPEFDGKLIDFAEARTRASFYKEFETEEDCKIRGPRKK